MANKDSRQVAMFFVVAALIVVGIIASRMLINGGGGQPNVNVAAPHVDSSNFEQEVLQANVIVMVDFYSDSCPPCRALAPTIASLCKEYESGITAKVYKLDVDKSPEIAQEYGVQYIPTLIFFKDGREVQRCVGLVSRETISAIITGQPIPSGG